MTANNQDFTLAAEHPADLVPVMGVGSGALLGGLEATCEDCMALMARYPDKHFDLAIVDPPYGIGAGEMTMGPCCGRRVWGFRSGLAWLLSQGAQGLEGGA